MIMDRKWKRHKLDSGKYSDNIYENKDGHTFIQISKHDYGSYKGKYMIEMGSDRDASSIKRVIMPTKKEAVIVAKSYMKLGKVV
jgi:hypothetical protein